ncbi:OmpA family protein [Roseomonas eburnea]|uniref:OmpA family protein n=1 Tax=Neoroseomonas eburnea TaxID=1346889 RepID=A0A9X9XFL1_9PROT|nr:OmpA family protein [Neoroseomonas eburnea]MBR0682497.1 OmpA family protein [Neoroseomonas eburnea]
MRTALPLAAILLTLAAGAADAQAPARDPLADTILRNLTRGIRVPGQGGDAVTAPVTPVTPADPRSPVQSATTAPPGMPAVSLLITFATGSATLTPDAEVLLASLARALTAPELARSRFRIEGHTDTVGSAALNQALSERRAEAVRGLLTQRYGIPAERLETLGLGETMLLVRTPDGTPEARNRRVQVINLGN